MKGPDVVPRPGQVTMTPTLRFIDATKDPMDIWPGNPYPLGATFDGSGVNFAVFSEVAERVELCLIDDKGAETRFDLREVDGYVWHAYLPEPPARSALRLPRARPVRPRERPPLQPRQAAARPLRQGHRRPDRRRRVPVLLPLRQARGVQRRRLPRPHHALGRGQPVLRLGPRPPAAARVPRERHLRGPRQGPDDDPPRHPRRDPRHLRRARPPGDDRAPQDARDHRDRADAGAPVRPGHHAGRQGPVQLLGLQHHRLPRAPQRLRRHGHPRAAGHRVQEHGQVAARGGHRGHPRRGLQPHRRGQRDRPDDRLPRPRQRGVLPAGRRATRRTTTTPRAPATAC